MNEYVGHSQYVKVRIVSSTLWGGKYLGQECEGIIYREGVRPQINTEQLTPPFPKWQSCDLSDIEVIDD